MADEWGIVKLPKERMSKSMVSGERNRPDGINEKIEFESGKSTQHMGKQVESVAANKISTSNSGMQYVQDFSDFGFDSVAEFNEPAQAVMLADDFELPAAMMHMAEMQNGQVGVLQLTPPMKAAVDHLVDEFYRDVAQAGESRSNSNLAAQELSEDQRNLVIDEDSGEVTRVIEPTDESLKATEKANRSHQLLFGDEATNRFGIQSKLEVKLSIEWRE